MKNGFTLVELAIVLVIIGFIIGGILVARSMIETAQLIQFVNKLQQLDIAVSNFRTKYNSLPGDSAAFGCTNSTNVCGDGQITSSNGAIDTWNGEIANFWPHLYQAGMMGDGKIYTSTILGYKTVFCNSNTVNGPVSPYKFAPNNGGNGNSCAGFLAFSSGGKSYYQTDGDSGDPNYAGKIQQGVAAVCYDGQLIDSKIDDGKRNTGKVVALNSQTLGLGTTPSNTCMDPGYGWPEADTGDYYWGIYAAHNIDCKKAFGGVGINLRFDMLAGQ